MRTRLKVCCIASVEEAWEAARAGADAIGLVGAMPSGPGVISDDRIREIAGAAPVGVATVLLTSRTDPQGVVDHVLSTRVTTVQLVDSVEPGVYAALRRHAPAVRIVQVLHVTGAETVAEARKLEGDVDAFLLDSGRPAAAVKELGGTGRTHDWSVSARIVGSVARPVFLAGGIRAENVEEAVRTVRPWGIDLCTGVRTDGRLDGAKLRVLSRVMRSADVGG